MGTSLRPAHLLLLHHALAHHPAGRRGVPAGDASNASRVRTNDTLNPVYGHLEYRRPRASTVRLTSPILARYQGCWHGQAEAARMVAGTQPHF